MADKGKIMPAKSSGKDERKKALDAVILQLEKQFGKGAIMKMDASSYNSGIEVISTGCLTLDLALGVGGVPRGRIIEIYGPESSGKTTVSLHIIAEAQKNGGTDADAARCGDSLYHRTHFLPVHASPKPEAIIAQALSSWASSSGPSHWMVSSVPFWKPEAMRCMMLLPLTLLLAEETVTSLWKAAMALAKSPAALI